MLKLSTDFSSTVENMENIKFFQPDTSSRIKHNLIFGFFPTGPQPSVENFPWFCNCSNMQYYKAHGSIRRGTQKWVANFSTEKRQAVENTKTFLHLLYQADASKAKLIEVQNPSAVNGKLSFCLLSLSR